MQFTQHPEKRAQLIRAFARQGYHVRTDQQMDAALRKLHAREQKQLLRVAALLDIMPSTVYRHLQAPPHYPALQRKRVLFCHRDFWQTQIRAAGFASETDADMRRAIVALYHSEQALSLVAARLHVSIGAITKHLRAEGVVMRPRGGSRKGRKVKQRTWERS